MENQIAIIGSAGSRKTSLANFLNHQLGVHGCAPLIFLNERKYKNKKPSFYKNLDLIIKNGIVPFSFLELYSYNTTKSILYTKRLKMPLTYKRDMEIKGNPRILVLMEISGNRLLNILNKIKQNLYSLDPEFIVYIVCKREEEEIYTIEEKRGLHILANEIAIHIKCQKEK